MHLLLRKVYTTKYFVVDINDIQLSFYTGQLANILYPRAIESNGHLSLTPVSEIMQD